MTFDPKCFFAEFRNSLNLSRGRDLVAKTYNADDTLRIFEAVDAACKAQPEHFPVEGKSYWNGTTKDREFLCDYTYHDPNHRILLSLESEWGVLSSPSRTTEEVIFDFKKVINMASPVKIMVFAYVDKDNEKSTRKAMADIVRKWPQDRLETLMAIACPWHDELHAGSIAGYHWHKGEWEPIPASS
ncbi:hypothetical protein ACFQH5_14710 [Halomonas salifodinae]|uniref:Uncharacterized protein n=1 Tax=Halomonas salifodinae TaxID=438745 RepID=A0ABW2EYG4_9GAMM